MENEQKAKLEEMVNNQGTPEGQKLLATVVLGMSREMATANMSQSDGSEAAMAQHMAEGHGHPIGPCLAMECETCEPVLVAMAKPITAAARQSMLEDINAAAQWAKRPDLEIVPEIYASWAEAGRPEADEQPPMTIAGVSFPQHSD